MNHEFNKQHLGWTNHITWTVVLLSESDEFLDEKFLELAKKAKSKADLAFELSKFFSSYIRSLVTNSRQYYASELLNDNEIISTLLLSSLNSVNWYEIAEAVLKGKPYAIPK
jgi:hypothetical protein